MDISEQRSYVIESFINIETILNGIIAQNYFGKVKENFLYEVLHDEYFNFGLKRRILEKITKSTDKNKIDKLNRLNKIRNYFSHCLFEICEKDPKNLKYVFIDPRDKTKKIDFNKLYNEFISLENEVINYLFDKFEELGGRTYTKS